MEVGSVSVSALRIASFTKMDSRCTQSLCRTDSRSYASHASALMSLICITTRQQRTAQLLTYSVYCTTTFFQRGVKHLSGAEAVPDSCRLVCLMQPTVRGKNVTHAERHMCRTCCGCYHEAAVITRKKHHVLCYWINNFLGASKRAS
jgi:hypothetical protein